MHPETMVGGLNGWWTGVYEPVAEDKSGRNERR